MKMDLNSDLIVSICAITISIVSIWIGIRYNRKTFNYQKEHDKLTTEPHLSLSVTVIKTEGHSIKLVNNGFGPCHIKSIKYFIKKKEYDSVSLLYAENFNSLKKNVEPSTGRYLNLGNSEIIGAGKSLLLLFLNFKKGYDTRPFIEFLKNVKIVITFINIYNDERIHEEPLINHTAFTGL